MRFLWTSTEGMIDFVLWPREQRSGCGQRARSPDQQLLQLTSPFTPFHGPGTQDSLIWARWAGRLRKRGALTTGGRLLAKVTERTGPQPRSCGPQPMDNDPPRTLGGGYSAAVAINAEGVIVGNSRHRRRRRPCICVDRAGLHAGFGCAAAWCRKCRWFYHSKGEMVAVSAARERRAPRINMVDRL